MAVKFLKKGAAAQKAVEQQDAKDEAAAKGNLYRFWMPEDAETQITFLDGDLNDDGLLDIPMYYEHQVNMNGDWKNWFVCTSEDEICPICEGGLKASLVGIMTIIDHTEWKDGKGKTHKNERKLFVAKRQTIKQLQKIATKRDGLAGITFDVSRVGEQSASVGNMFDYIGKKSVAATLKKFKFKPEEGAADYEEVITYRSAKELRKLGFGSSVVGQESDDDGDDNDYDDDL